ncbi:MAG: UbiA family prenyltransferase [Candidatus Aenigmatarchaeota archaeon]|nr:MAG: UbiA family prenyltransferase [Candidatus Aenigmarchaeota archaeon]
MLELLGMVRPLNGVMGMVGVFIGGLIAVGFQSVYTIPFFFGLVAVFLITGAGNVFNDYVDVEADRVNRPRSPIPSGRVSRGSALAFSLMLFVLGNFCALMINGLCFTIAMINSFLLIMYSVSFQHKILLGNLTIGYLVGSVFLFGGAVFLEIRLVLILMVLATLSTISREIVKDMEDIQGDRKSFLKKLTSKISKASTPIAERFGITTKGVRMKYRERTMIVLAIACLILAILFSFLPYYYGILKMSYLAVVVVADLVFLSSIYSLGREKRRRKGYTRISQRLKIGMFIALLAFIVGVLI